MNLKGEVDAAWGSEPSTPSAPESGVKRLAPATPGLKAAAAAFVPAAAAAAMHSARVRMSGCPDQDGGLGHDKPPAPSDSIPAADPGDDKATAAVPSDVARVAMQLPDGTHSTTPTAHRGRGVITARNFACSWLVRSRQLSFCHPDFAVPRGRC